MQEIHVDSLAQMDAQELTEVYRIPTSPHVRTNMVMSSDGYFVDVDGASRHFSSPEDMRIFNLLRSLSDVVLVGARTAVMDNYGQIKIREEFLGNRLGPDDVPTIALVSESLRIPFDARLFTMAGPRPIVFTVPKNDPEWTARRNKLAVIADVVDIDKPQSDVREQVMIDSLHERGLSRILCEGGPTLLDRMLNAHLVSHLAVTVSTQRSRYSEANVDSLPQGFRIDSAIHADGQDFLQLHRV